MNTDEMDFNTLANMASQYNKASTLLVVARDVILAYPEASELRKKLTDLQLEVRREAQRLEEAADDAALEEMPF